MDDVPDPVVTPHHVLVRPLYSLISSGTETASIHESVLKEVADNPSHLRKIWDVMKVNGPVRTLAEVQAKFTEYAALGYSRSRHGGGETHYCLRSRDWRYRGIWRRRYRACRDYYYGPQPGCKGTRRRLL